MSDEILGPHGDRLALKRALDDELGASLGMGSRVLLERLLDRLLAEPGVRELFYKLAEDHPHGPMSPADDRALVTYLAEGIATGALQVGTPDLEQLWYVRERTARTDYTPGQTDVAAPQQADSEPPETKEFVKDWHWQCAHHAAPYDKRGQTDRQAWGRTSVDDEGRSIRVIDVVPNFVGNVVPSDPGEDEVHFYWKDEERGSPPKPELFVNTAGKPEAKVLPAGNEAGYTKYSFKTPYLGGQDKIVFITRSFWDEFLHRTQYRLEGGPQPLRVDVYHPRRYKFTLKMPPLAGYKRGAKLGADSADPRKLAKPDNLKESIEEERSGWGRSKQTSTDGGAWEDGSADSKREHGEAGHKLKGAADNLPIKFARDDVALDPGGLITTIASILRMYRLIFGIIDTIKDWAPQVGFYVDFALEILTGELSVEWMWKEFEDHRAYAAIDVMAKVTVFKVTLEMGIGVSACGGKLQVFAQVEGALDMQMNVARTSPDGDMQIPFEVKPSITGAIGARVEAGSFVKLEGKGQTGFELVVKVTIGIGSREPPVRFEITPTWTGISFTGTFSAGAWGVSYEKSGTYKLVNPIALALVKIPDNKPYEPPIMSKRNIAMKFQTTFYTGTNVLVYREGTGWVDIEPICDQLADAVMADKGFTQTPKDIEALALSVREDWRETSRMARSQTIGRNYVDWGDVQRYITGAGARGCSLRKHLAAGQQDPMLSSPCG